MPQKPRSGLTRDRTRTYKLLAHKEILGKKELKSRVKLCSICVNLISRSYRIIPQDLKKQSYEFQIASKFSSTCIRVSSRPFKGGGGPHAFFLVCTVMYKKGGLLLLHSRWMGTMKMFEKWSYCKIQFQDYHQEQPKQQ